MIRIVLRIARYALILVVIGLVASLAWLRWESHQPRDEWWQERHGSNLNRIHHASIAGVALILASVLSEFGIVDLIAEGYGSIAWGFLFVYLIPLFTVGVYRLCKPVAQISPG